MGAKKNWQLPWILPIPICMLEIRTERPTEFYPVGWFRGQTGPSAKITAIACITSIVSRSPHGDVRCGSSLGMTTSMVTFSLLLSFMNLNCIYSSMGIF